MYVDCDIILINAVEGWGMGDWLLRGMGSRSNATLLVLPLELFLQ